MAIWVSSLGVSSFAQKHKLFTFPCGLQFFFFASNCKRYSLFSYSGSFLLVKLGEIIKKCWKLKDTKYVGMCEGLYVLINTYFVYGFNLVVGKEGEITIGTINGIERFQIHTIPLGEHPC